MQFFRRSIAIFVIVLALFTSAAIPPVVSASVRDTDQLDGASWTEFDIQHEIMPDVTMAAGALVDGDGRILWSRNLDERRPPASISKIMTAILVVENMDSDEEFVMPAMPIGPAESRAHLREGDVLTREQLIQALLIVSGNDAAHAVAVEIAGDVPSFAEMMNERAEQLGMNDTQFRNASGIDQQGQFSTARDIATLSRFALSIPEIREVVGTAELNFEIGRGSQEWVNTNILLQSYEGATGVKTGFTSGAGHSLAMSAQRDELGLELIAVVLGARADVDRFFDARHLLDFGFTHYRTQDLAIKNAVKGRAQVSNFPDRTVQAAVSEDVSLHVLDVAGPIEQSIEINSTRSPVRRGDMLGHISFTQRGRLVARVPLVATEDVNNPFFLVQWYYNVVIALRGGSD
ncbi:MAG: D-alanyl-D-alanine carboxypeptidase [Coriobacteriia bacterium]|nr:D-alanyl-D-alanine carboxypeptidase [Coriobacteriia bacterium]